MPFLDKSNIIAPEGYNRWRVPTAALAIHLCIGQIWRYLAAGSKGSARGEPCLLRHFRFSGGFFISALGVWWHRIWLVKQWLRRKLSHSAVYDNK